MFNLELMLVNIFNFLLLYSPVYSIKVDNPLLYFTMGFFCLNSEHPGGMLVSFVTEFRGYWWFICLANIITRFNTFLYFFLSRLCSDPKVDFVMVFAIKTARIFDLDNFITKMEEDNFSQLDTFQNSLNVKKTLNKS